MTRRPRLSGRWNLSIVQFIHSHYSFISHADTLSPVYGETFTFKIPDDVGLHNVVLNVKVMDKDLLMDDKMGGTTINLEPLGLSETPSLVNAVVDKKSFLFSSGSRDGAGCVYRCQKAICSAVQVVIWPLGLRRITSRRT